MLILVQRPQHKSTSDPVVTAPKSIPFGTIFIEFGDTKTCCTFSGLELAPKSRKKLIGALSCMHKGPKCIQSLWNHPKKIPFVQKHNESVIFAILREETHFGAFPEAKKASCRSQLHAQRSKMHSIPLGPSEKNSFCVKAQRKRDMCDPYGKNHILGPFQRLKKLTGALTCMHKGPKCIQSLWDHPKKIPFVQKHKEGAICAILRETTSFFSFPEAKKGVVNSARLRKAAHWPNNNANPSGLLEKKFIV